MDVKTGDLKNNLSRYLKRMAETGEAITILDRNTPIARISPLRGRRGVKKGDWARERAVLLKKAEKLGIKISIPEKEPKPMRDIRFNPRIASDGKTDANTVVAMRREKDY